MTVELNSSLRVERRTQLRALAVLNVSALSSWISVETAKSSPVLSVWLHCPQPAPQVTAVLRHKNQCVPPAFLQGRSIRPETVLEQRGGWGVFVKTAPLLWLLLTFLSVFC